MPKMGKVLCFEKKHSCLIFLLLQHILCLKLCPHLLTHSTLGFWAANLLEVSQGDWGHCTPDLTPPWKGWILGLKEWSLGAQEGV